MTGTGAGVNRNFGHMIRLHTGSESVLDPIYVFDQCEERLIVPRVMGTARLNLLERRPIRR